MLQNAASAEAALSALQSLARAPGASFCGHALGNGDKTSALHLAISKHRSPKLVQLLCEKGARVDFESQVIAAHVKLVSCLAHAPSHPLGAPLVGYWVGGQQPA